MKTLLSFRQFLSRNPVIFKNVLSLSCLVLLLSCSVAQRVPPTTYPPIALLFFENGTNEPMIEQQFSPILKERFIRRGMNRIQNSNETAFVLSGKIVQFESAFKSLNENGQATEYQITIGVASKLTEKGKAEPALKMDLMESADYLASSDPAMNRDRRDRAIREAAFRLSDRTVDLVSDFLSESR
ncbi:MAG: LPS assembly lipoprotein LptE [Nitrospirota bacterium]